VVQTGDTNIHNPDKLKFCKSYCAGHLACQNPKCDYLKKTSHHNEIEWVDYTPLPFAVCSTPPRDCSLVCKVCKTILMCLKTCDSRIYYCYSDNPQMSRTAIYFGNHSHPIAKGMYKDSAQEINGLIAEQVSKTLSATNSTIALSANKDFLIAYLFHNEGEKEILRGEELEEVMDCFQYLNSPNIRNIISSFCSNN